MPGEVRFGYVTMYLTDHESRHSNLNFMHFARDSLHRACPIKLALLWQPVPQKCWSQTRAWKFGLLKDVIVVGKQEKWTRYLVSRSMILNCEY